MSTNAFDVLMRKATPVCPPDDPWYTAVIYEAHLEHVDESEPLWRVPYFGQVVRAGTAEENFEARKRQHERDTIRDPKDLGFHAVIGMYGTDKIEWRIVSSKPGRRSEVQAWADAEEIRLIAEHGGVLRNMDAKLKQTLNLTKGGQGDPAVVWASIEAKRRRVFSKFKAAMEAYVEEHGSALVPKAYVDDDGYPLGQKLNDFRHGVMRKGMSDQTHIEAWAEALPKWAWNARETDEWREGRTQRLKDMWKNESAEAKAKRIAKFRATLATDASKAKRSKISKDRFANESAEAKADRIAKTRAAMATDASKAKQVQAAKDRMANESAEAKAERIAKFRATMATDASKAKRSKSSKDRFANESAEAKADRIAKFRAAMATAASKAKRSKISKDQMANESAEAKADRIARFRAAIATDASKAKRSKTVKDRVATQRRAELKRARTIAVPFVKSKKRRKELRAASAHTKPSGQRGDNVLYMISEDGKTIRRVNKDGMMRERAIVGPVVDPAPPDAFDSDSDWVL